MKNVTKSIFVASDAELEDRKYRERLKAAVCREVLHPRIAGEGRHGEIIGQREWPTAIQDAMLYACIYGINLLYVTDEEFEVPLVDDVWKNERYVRVFLDSEQCKHPEKDRLIDLYFRIMRPEIAQTFGQ